MTPERDVQFLLSCSKSLLENIELTRLNLASNISKQIRELVDKYSEALACAQVARWLIDNGDELRERATIDARQEVLQFESEELPDVPPLKGLVVSLPRDARLFAKTGNR